VREKINAHGSYVVKPEGKRPFGRPRHKWGIVLKRTLKVEW
jgi:hypothetical protein